MKLIIAAALAATALTAVAAPALAQPYGPPRHHDHDYGPPPQDYGDIHERIERAQERINRGREDGGLDPREAERCQAELNSIKSEEQRDLLKHWGRLRDGDRQHLGWRLDRLGATIHWMREDDRRRPW